MCVYCALTMIATWSVLLMYHVRVSCLDHDSYMVSPVHVPCLNHGSYMISPIHTQFWICDWLGSKMAVRSVWVQSHSLLSLVTERPFAASDQPCTVWSPNYVLLFTFSFLFICGCQCSCGMLSDEVLYTVIGFGFRLVELKKSVVHQVEVRTHMA